jgi:hypothetical protein
MHDENIIYEMIALGNTIPLIPNSGLSQSANSYQRGYKHNFQPKAIPFQQY